MTYLLSWTEQPPLPERPELLIWSSLLPEEAAELRSLAAGRRVVEIGTAFGYSTLVMAAVARHVWTIDPHEVRPAAGLFGFQGDPGERYNDGTRPVLEENIAAAGLTQRVTVCQGRSQSLLSPHSELDRELRGKADLAFIDGDHSADAAYTDLTNCARIVGRGGVVALHDYDEGVNPGVKVAVDRWSGEQGISIRLVATLAVIDL